MSKLKKHQESFIKELEKTYKELNVTGVSEKFNFIDVGAINTQVGEKEVRAKEIIAENRAMKIAHVKVYKKDIELLAVDLEKLGFKMVDRMPDKEDSMHIAFVYGDGRKYLIHFKLVTSSKIEVKHPNLPCTITSVSLTVTGGCYYNSVAEAVKESNLQQIILSIKTQ